jgi:hypothetical protein
MGLVIVFVDQLVAGEVGCMLSIINMRATRKQQAERVIWGDRSG